MLELLKEGANTGVPDSKGRTALHFAACRPDVNIGKDGGGVSVLHSVLFPPPNTPIPTFNTHTHIPGLVKLLASYGTVNQRDCNGNTPLHLGVCGSLVQTLYLNCHPAPHSFLYTSCGRGNCTSASRFVTVEGEHIEEEW